MHKYFDSILCHHWGRVDDFCFSKVLFEHCNNEVVKWKDWFHSDKKGADCKVGYDEKKCVYFVRSSEETWDILRKA